MINPPSGSSPTKAPAQIALTRARIASEATVWTTTVERPTKITPEKPPITPRPSDNGTLAEAPTAATAAAVSAKLTTTGSPLLGRRARSRRTTEPTSEPRPIEAVRAPSVPAPPCS